ncbi:MAG: hypothetical protein ACRC8A_16375 [Microcoleaceae cyanobacterium]
MGSALRYWQWVRLNGAGDRQQEEIPEAKAFFGQQFSEWVDSDKVPDAAIQRQLIDWFRSEPSAENSAHQSGAEACLRCFISYQIDQTCSDLFQCFGKEGGFRSADLLSLVLDDFELLPRSSPKPASSYESLANKILRTFNPERAQLSTWTVRLVKSHEDLVYFLGECGVYLRSDWAILNNHHPRQLERLLTQVHGYSQITANRAAEILDSYQTVYLADRLQQRSCSRCQTPTPQQLDRMVANLVEKGIANYRPDRLLEQLAAIAELIRQRQPKLEPPPDDIYPDKSPLDETEQEIQEFLQRYRQVLMDQLDKAIQQVLNDRVNYLKRTPPKDLNFLKGLRLHCQGQPMATIAKQIGLSKQYQVSRLLQLTAMRQDVQQRLLTSLKHPVFQLASYYTDRIQLTHLERVVAEEVDRIMAAADRETGSSNCARNSLFTRRLCRYL